jgi:hypothetical protein
MARKKTIRIYYRAAAHVPLWKVMEGRVFRQTWARDAIWLHGGSPKEGHGEAESG